MSPRIDFNADIGPWAFRRLEHKTVEATLRLMDGHGIDRALAGPVPGITYRNCHMANEELAEELASCAGASDRILQAAVLNPMYPGVEEDFRRCIEQFGCRALKLYPNYHDYQCWRSESVDLCRLAADAGLPILVVVRVEDERYHHWRMLIPATPLDDILKLVEAVPQGKFVLVAGTAPETARFIKSTEDRPECMAEVSYVKSPLNAIEAIVESCGADRLLYGTHLPFIYPAVNTEKITTAEIPEADMEAILGGNAARMLG